jgi:uncharacterized OsmC-like protein
MSATTMDMPAKAQPMPHHGVDTPKLFATINAVAGAPALAAFTFKAKGTWQHGTHMQSTISGFHGAGAEHSHRMAFTADADHPAVLCGEDKGPTPVEYLLHALAACLTAGVANIAAARGVELESVTCTVEGDIDLQGILGLSDQVRNGFSGIRATFDIKGDAPAAKLQQILDQAKARSAVFDVFTNGVPVNIAMAA